MGGKKGNLPIEAMNPCPMSRFQGMQGTRHSLAEWDRCKPINKRLLHCIHEENDRSWSRRKSAHWPSPAGEGRLAAPWVADAGLAVHAGNLAWLWTQAGQDLELALDASAPVCLEQASRVRYSKRKARRAGQDQACLGPCLQGLISHHVSLSNSRRCCIITSTLDSSYSSTEKFRGLNIND